VFDHGKQLRHVDAADGTVKESGKRLPEEHGIDWKDSGAETVMYVVQRLGTPFSLYERTGPCTVFDVK